MSVINIEKKIIFVHIPKTAGTSMEKALGNMNLDKGSTYNHLDINELLMFARHNLCGSGISEFFKFAFVRNPFERVGSIFSNSSIKTKEHLLELLQRKESILTIRKQLSYICDPKGNILVDFIGRYENLEEDWKSVCDVIGEYLPLPHIRTGNTGCISKPYSQYYDSIIKENIRCYFEEDFKRFGYG